MFVYRTNERALTGRETVMVSPGTFHPLNAEWKDKDGKPKSFSVEFVLGRAEVPDNLGQWLIDMNMASRSPIILPPGVKI